MHTKSILYLLCCYDNAIIVLIAWQSRGYVDMFLINQLSTFSNFSQSILTYYDYDCFLDLITQKSSFFIFSFLK